MRSRPPGYLLARLILVLIAGLFIYLFKKYPISDRSRRWCGLVFMIATILDVSDISTPFHHYDDFGLFALVFGLCIWGPLTYYAKYCVMECWIAMIIGTPLARYVGKMVIYYHLPIP